MSQDKYLVYKISDIKLPTIVEMLEVNEDGTKCKVKLHPRPDYTVEECKEVAKWLNERGKS